MNTTPVDSRSEVRRLLLSWYRRHKRDLPWRRKPSLYRTILSEFMLQQTRVDQALPYYERFLACFPDFETLAAAPKGEVLKLWAGLGYYRRAGHLHETAKRLAGHKQIGVEELASCPGIGPYTLAAVASIVLGQALPVVDGNVNRVMARMLALDGPPARAAGKARILETLAAWISPHAPGAWNQGLMELGATLCTPRNPQCPRCPWKTHCRAFALGKSAEFPVTVPKPPRPHRAAAAAVVQRHDGRILIAQRPESGMLAGLWEFPGAYCEKPESLKACCSRGVREACGVRVQVGEKLDTVRHGYSHFSVTMHIYAACYSTGRARALGCQSFKWVKRAKLMEYPFPRVFWKAQKHLATLAK